MRSKGELAVPWLFAAIVIAYLNLGPAHAAPLMIVGNDEKLLWDDDGKRVLFPAGKDSVVILDLADPENPKITANLHSRTRLSGRPSMWRSTRPTRSRWSPI